MARASDRVSRVLRRIRGKTMRLFEAGAEAAAAHYSDDVSTPWPPASVVGEFPHLRTGQGQAAIRSFVLDTGDLRTSKAGVVLEESGIHLHYLTSPYWARLGMEESFFLHYNDILQAMKSAS